jgi:hypothetical protein
MPAGEAGRAGSARYGAVGGGIAALAGDLYRKYVRGEDIGAGQVALDVGVNTTVGGATAVGFDALAPRLGSGAPGMVKAGGAIGGLLEGGLSLWNNADAYRDGRERASQATANVLVDTGIGVGAGASGAALGAALGSIVPGLGTAVGAGIGFVAGMAGSYLVHALADNTGFTGWAKQGLGDLLSGAEKPLGVAWDGVSSATGAVEDAASSLWRWVTE